ncbi:unnamed protein product [Protopolystoma xenopodis]|uniref:Uncharacterized protein n=1 Tax=Protopolystoma xenopodis TaxID=117903 RepID=A0A3S5BDN6_9PLAT|nr:unnamed protein product [Protopolystoma xenopodis]
MNDTYIDYEDEDYIEDSQIRIPPTVTSIQVSDPSLLRRSTPQDEKPVIIRGINASGGQLRHLVWRNGQLQNLTPAVRPEIPNHPARPNHNHMISSNFCPGNLMTLGSGSAYGDQNVLLMPRQERPLVTVHMPKLPLPTGSAALFSRCV